MATRSAKKQIEGIRALEKDWLRRHVWMNTAATLLLVAVEAVIFYLVKCTDSFPMEESVFLYKYLYAPAISCGSCLVIQWLVWLIPFSTSTKKYVISLGMAVTCFVAYSVHQYYSVLQCAFMIPVILTVAYGDLTLTRVIAGICISLELVSEFYVFWDEDKQYALSSMDNMVKFLLGIVIQLLVFGMSRVILNYEWEKVELAMRQEREQNQLKKEAYKDLLTDLPNRVSLRRSFDDMLANLEGNTYHLVMMDIDRFKMVNDQLGHLEGDRVLRELGKIYQEKCTLGQAFRFGGDEFCMLFKNVSEDDIVETCRQIQKAFQTIGTDQTDAIGMTLSFGIAEHDNVSRPVWLIQEADNELYLAKKKRSSISIHGKLIEP